MDPHQRWPCALSAKALSAVRPPALRLVEDDEGKGMDDAVLKKVLEFAYGSESTIVDTLIR